MATTATACPWPGPRSSFLFATGSWRASPDCADRLGYDRALLKQNKATSAALCAELTDEFATVRDFLDKPLDHGGLALSATARRHAGHMTKYEVRGASLMPHNLIVPFCLGCRVSVEWLLTGLGPTRPR